MERRVVINEETVIRRLHAELVEVRAILEAVETALDGEAVSDFMESFPIVRAALDLRDERDALKCEREDMAYRQRTGEDGRG